MKLTNKGKTFALLLSLSALFSYLIIYPYYFPYFGVSLSLTLFALFVYIHKKKKTKTTKINLFFTIIFASLVSIRSQGFITFVNILSSLYFGSLMMLSDGLNKINGQKILTAPFFLIFKGLFTPSKYKLEFRERPTNFFEKFQNVSGNIVAFGITLLILFIVPPILASANPIFSDRLDEFYSLFNLKRLFDFLFNNILLLQRFLFFFALLMFLPRMVTYMNKAKNKNLVTSVKKFNLELTLPKAVTSLIIFLFFITQFQLYFSSQEILAEMGYSYSQYTNEVFGQLSIVSLIIILIMYIENRSGKYTKSLNYLLILQGIFLTLMAFKSDYEYSYTYGFTYKRLYGFAVVTYILGVFLLQFLSYYKNWEKNKFIFYSLVYSGIILISVNLFNFDYLIYHYRKSVTGQGVDYQYLSRLSPDSLSYKDQLDKVESLYNSNSGYKADYAFAGNNLVWKIEQLQNKYSKPDIRKFNLLEYMQYQEIKSVNVEEKRELFSSYYLLPVPLEKKF